MIDRRAVILGAGACLLAPPALAFQEVAARIFALCNATRQNRGRSRLKRHLLLGEAAHGHAKRMLQTGQFSHTAGGTRLTRRVAATGYRYRRISENIAWISRRNANAAAIAQALHEMWMNSPGHRRNILDQRVSHIGIGVARAGAKTYAVQIFGQPE